MTEQMTPGQKAAATRAARRAAGVAATTAVYEYRWTRHQVAELGATIRTPDDAIAAAAAVLRPDEREDEAIVVVLLNVKNAIIGTELVVMGQVANASVTMGQLFRAAVRLNAPHLILAHNHPSGDPTPSPQDAVLTNAARAAGKLLGIDVLDHIILGAGGRWLSVGRS